MAKLSTKKASKTHKVMVYGAPFTGKSQLAGELSEFFNLIWVDMENGHDVLFKFPTEWQDRIELIELKDTRSYPIAIETCLKMVKGPVSVCETHGKVSCMLCKREEKDFVGVDLANLKDDTIVIFDSATQLTSSGIAHITKAESDDYKMKTDDWGNLGKLMDTFYSHIQQANYNVVCISHETEAETEGKKKTLVPIAGSRNFSRNVAKYFDAIVYAERKNKKHVFASSTSYATNILTGSRADVEMEDADKPSLLAIFKPEIYKQRQGEEKKEVGSSKAARAAGKGIGSSNSAALSMLAKLKKASK